MWSATWHIASKLSEFGVLDFLPSSSWLLFCRRFYFCTILFWPALVSSITKKGVWRGPFSILSLLIRATTYTPRSSMFSQGSISYVVFDSVNMKFHMRHHSNLLILCIHFKWYLLITFQVVSIDNRTSLLIYTSHFI